MSKTFAEEVKWLAAEVYGFSVGMTTKQVLEEAHPDSAANQTLDETTQAILKLVEERIIGKNDPLAIPEFPRVDDEGEALYSKRAAREGRKQVTARYHSRKELRKEQRQRLYEGVEE